jgi:hypothetical protein
MAAPANPKIYHITSVSNLPRIIEDGGLFSDVEMLARGGPEVSIGMPDIKTRRLGLPVRCHQGLTVGGCVPFYFCSRSIMLYLLHMANHPGLSNRNGQSAITHLELDLHEVVEWANRNNVRWAFTLTNAATTLAEFRSDLCHLNEINWDAVAATKWAGPNIPPEFREYKQAEFLVEQHIPWTLVSRIGVLSREIFGRAQDALEASHHKPKVEIKRDWYY